MKALIIGKGASGEAAKALLKKLNYKIKMYDDKTDKKTKNKIVIKDYSLVVVSPGVNVKHELIEKARRSRINVISELELGFLYSKGRIVAITGTNGKTTTTSLIGHILKDKNPFVAGNIGLPFCDICLNTKKEDTVVLEVSSFQLELVKHFHAHISIMCNIAPDHLDRHGSMKNYIKQKLKVFKNQQSSDFAVLNYDDKLVRNLAKYTNAKCLYFSTKKEVDCGAFVKDKSIYFKNQAVYKVCDISEVTLIGEHNLQNVLAAVCACFLLGEKPETIKEGIKTFSCARHRIEFVSEVSGVKFFNDSKSTNINSTIVALAAVKVPVCLILGGSDKDNDFDVFFHSKYTNLKKIVTVGETAYKVYKSACKFGYKNNCYIASGFKEAVNAAYKFAENGEAVLLSPACASFDMFRDYKHRGDVFCSIVKELKNNEQSEVKKE